MTQIVDRAKVSESFGKHAAHYDRYATVQKRVVRELLGLVKSHHSESSTLSILDVGCGTGELLSLLRDSYVDAELFGIDLAPSMIAQALDRVGNSVKLLTGDAESLPFADASFDLLVSTSTMQWLHDLSPFLDEAYRVLKPAGMLCAAFFAGSTLKELHNCYHEVVGVQEVREEGVFNNLHSFHSFKDVQAVLERSLFDKVVLSSETETEWYANLNEMLRSIKRIGAGGKTLNASSRRGGLGWRGVLNKMSLHYYNLYSKSGKIPANYEVFYLIARK